MTSIKDLFLTILDKLSHDGSEVVQLISTPKRRKPEQRMNRARGDPFFTLMDTLSAHFASTNENIILVIPSALSLESAEDAFLVMLQDLCSMFEFRVSPILISEAPWDAFPSAVGLPPPMKVCASEFYDKSFIRKTLVEYRDGDCASLKEKFSQAGLSALDFESLFRDFVHYFVDLAWIACRDVYEMRHHVPGLFELYIAPVIAGKLGPGDTSALVKNAQAALRSAMLQLFSRTAAPLASSQSRVGASESDLVPDNQFDDDVAAVQAMSASKTRLANLPARTKFLLLAAYLAGKTPSRLDMKYFAPLTVRKRKRRTNRTDQRGATVLSQAADEQSKPFEIERLLCVFYSIYEPNLVLTASGLPFPRQLCDPYVPDSVFRDVSTLCSLKLLSRSSESSVELSNFRLRSNVDVETAKLLAADLSIDLSQYMEH
eukprot:ANDGO_03606.mRNA.2 Origin recognition complex subunit 5